MSKAKLSAIAKELGRRGGLARAQRMTAKERSESARKAGLAGGRGRGKKGDAR